MTKWRSTQPLQLAVWSSCCAFFSMCLCVCGCGVEAGSLLIGAALFGHHGTGGGGGNGQQTPPPSGSPIPPGILDLHVTTSEDLAASIEVLPKGNISAEVLAALNVTITGGPAHGTATVDGATKVVQYTPALNFNGEDQFGFLICDNANPPLCASANVLITVSPVNDPPIGVNDAASVTEDVLPNSVTGNVLINDTDVDISNTLTVASVEHSSGNVGVSVAGNFGILTLSADGAFNYTLDNTLPAVQRLPVGQAVQDIFAYGVTDGTAIIEAMLTIHVGGSNDMPHANMDPYSINQGETLTVASATGILANDFDVDQDDLAAALISGPASGTVTLNPDGSFTYTPDANFTGTDSFSYRANDGLEDSNAATVEIRVEVEGTSP